MYLGFAPMKSPTAAASPFLRGPVTIIENFHGSRLLAGFFRGCRFHGCFRPCYGLLGLDWVRKYRSLRDKGQCRFLFGCSFRGFLRRGCFLYRLRGGLCCRFRP